MVFDKKKDKKKKVDEEKEEVASKLYEVKPLTTGLADNMEIMTASFTQKIYEVLENIDVKKYWKDILVNSFVYVLLFILLTFSFFGLIYQAFFVSGEPTFTTGIQYGIFFSLLAFIYGYYKGWYKRDRVMEWVDINGGRKIPIKIIDMGDENGIIKFIPYKVSPFYEIQPKDLVNPNRPLTIAMENVACKLSNDVLVSASVIERDGIISSYYGKVDFRYIPDEDKTRFVRQIDELNIQLKSANGRIEVLNRVIDGLYGLLKGLKIKDLESSSTPILAIYRELRRLTKEEAEAYLEQLPKAKNENEEEEF